MTTIDALTQEQRDRHEVARLAAEGRRVTDPELLRRIRERAEAVRQASLREFGVQDIGVGIIRELRDAE
jgi:hypothetical protein